MAYGWSSPHDGWGRLFDLPWVLLGSSGFPVGFFLGGCLGGDLDAGLGVCLFFCFWSVLECLPCG